MAESLFKPAKRREPAPPGDILCGLVAYRGQSRSFEIATGNGAETYDIAWDRIMTPEQFTDWLWQIQEKSWITGEHLADFLQCLSEYIYRQWGEFPQAFYGVCGKVQTGLDRDSTE